MFSLIHFSNTDIHAKKLVVSIIEACSTLSAVRESGILVCYKILNGNSKNTCVADSSVRSITRFSVSPSLMDGNKLILYYIFASYIMYHSLLYVIEGQLTSNSLCIELEELPKWKHWYIGGI